MSMSLPGYCSPRLRFMTHARMTISSRNPIAHIIPMNHPSEDTADSSGTGNNNELESYTLHVYSKLTHFDADIVVKS